MQTFKVLVLTFYLLLLPTLGAAFGAVGGCCCQNKPGKVNPTISLSNLEEKCFPSSNEQHLFKSHTLCCISVWDEFGN